MVERFPQQSFKSNRQETEEERRARAINGGHKPNKLDELLNEDLDPLW